jgi:hypothetical protein
MFFFSTDQQTEQVPNNTQLKPCKCIEQKMQRRKILYQELWMKLQIMPIVTYTVALSVNIPNTNIPPTVPVNNPNIVLNLSHKELTRYSPHNTQYR